MMSTTTPTPMPETGSSVTRSWMKANAVAAAIYVVIGMITFASDKLLGLGEPTTGMLFRGIGGAIVFAAMVLMFVVYAMLTGAAFGEKIPGLSRREWIAMYAGMGVVFGVIFGVATLFGPASSDPPAEMPSQTIMLVGVLIGSLIVGPIVGAVFGGLQALVLRRAAAGAGAWILWSMISCTVSFLVLMSVVLMLAGASMDSSKLGLGGQLGLQAAVFGVVVLGAVIMLPAVKRLTPRG
jgi:hypothetical protein